MTLTPQVPGRLARTLAVDWQRELEFLPDTAPWFQLLSVKQKIDYLYLATVELQNLATVELQTITASHRGMFKSAQFVKEPAHRVELVRCNSKIGTEHISGAMVHLSGASRFGVFWSSRLFFGGGQHGKSGSWFV